MMNTRNDLFGPTNHDPVFRDIRDQRPTVAEQKAILCKTLGNLLRVVPASICSSDIQTTRGWLKHHSASKKIMSNSRSSCNELQTAIDQMSSFK